MEGIRKELNLSYSNGLFQGSLCKIDRTTNKIIVRKSIETEYLDKLLLFVRVHWTEEIPKVYDIVRSLMETGEYHDAYEF